MTGPTKRREFLAQTMAASAAMALLPGSSATAAEPVTHEVEIKRFKYVPDALTVKPGDRIVWTNRDIAPHTATGVDESWDTGKLAKGEAQTVTVIPDMQADYYCRYHPNMKARLIIEAA